MRLLSALLLLFTLGLSPAFADQPIIPLFNAEYLLQHNKLEIGRVELSVEALGNNRYQLTSTTRNSGLLSFIQQQKLVESSLFELIDGQIRPIQYRYLKQSKQAEKDVRLDFNWQQLSVTNASDGESWKMPISNGVLDKALMQIALMLDLKQSNKAISYQVADGGRLKQYRFELLGDDKSLIKGQWYQTKKFARRKGQHKNITYYWCAPALHNLPVLLQREKKYGQFEMRLQKVRFSHSISNDENN
ncbi:MAG: DUF3108 domain-containing protein [Cycloclasticus sp.]